MTIIAAADGSALGNPGPAGWAWYIDESRWRCGGWTRGTNNQGELAAVLDLLRQTAHSPEPLHILCDSQYVINSVTKWMVGWKRKGWKKADGKPVLNVEVMKALDEAMTGREVTFEWVKGHAGHELNEKADVLANGAAKAHASRREPEAGPGFPGAQAVGAGDDPAVPPAADGGTGSAGARRSSGSADTTTTTKPAVTSEPDLFSMDSDAAASHPAAEELVVDLERALLTDAVRRDRRKLTRLLDVRWRQVDPAGRTWTRRELGDADVSPGGVELEVVETRRLADDVVLLLWRASGPRGASSVHSSIWQRTGDDWKQIYQQGTREG
ncbi:ribonuclease HI family protein [Dietzia cercidiphylli]|uniref:ribonuclease HI family protein n=2 Tax=Dietzia cercidiphylli TaxID=498199 RepID=UPI0031DEBCD4